MTKNTNPYAALFDPFFTDPFEFFAGPQAFPPFWGFAGEQPKGKGGKKHGKKLEDGSLRECAADAVGAEGRGRNAETALAQPPRPEHPQKSFFKMYSGLMRTDVKETDEAYELAVNLPGFAKEDVKVQLHDGYLNISAERASESEEKDENGTLIRQERYSGACSRSFYVGDEIVEDGVHAKFENGVLLIELPKDVKALEEKAPALIAID